MNKYMNPINNIPVNENMNPRNPIVLINLNINTMPIVSEHKNRKVNANINKKSVRLYLSRSLIFLNILIIPFQVIISDNFSWSKFYVIHSITVNDV